MSTNSLKSSRQQMMFFFYCSLLLSIFFLIQIRYTLSLDLAEWTASQYTLLFLLLSFVVICFLKYQCYSRDLKRDSQCIDLAEKKLTQKKNALYQQVSSMNPSDFGELVADLSKDSNEFF